MSYYDESSESIGFITYSMYGAQRNIVMNKNGAVFSCNPIQDWDMCKIYSTREAAEAAKDEFYDKVNEVVLVGKTQHG